MTRANSLDLAKKGDPQAIAALINQSLQPKGVTVKAMVASGCLTLIAEPKEAVDREALVAFIRKGVTGLDTSAIQRVIIQMREVGKTTLAWREAFDIGSASAAAAPSSASQNGNRSGTVAVDAIEAKAKSSRLHKLFAGVKEFGTPSLLAAILLVLISNRFAANQPPAKPTIWEYQVTSAGDLSFDSTMQRLGAEGWEVASARRAVSGEGSSSKGIYELILKRPISESQARENVKNMEIHTKEHLGKTTLGLINSFQRSRYLQKSAFATDFTELEVADFVKGDNYTYNMTADTGKEITTAVAKVDGIRSYSSGTFVVGSGSTATTVDAICISASATKTPPGEPQLNGTEATCPSGSKKLD